MVVLIRDLRNILFQISAFIFGAQNMALDFGDCEMTDIHDVSNIISPSDDYNKMRGHTVLFSSNHSRSSLLSSDVSAEEYAVRMQRKSDRMDQDDPPAPSTNSFLVEYKTVSKQALHVNKITDTHNPARQQCVLTMKPTLNKPVGKNVFNVWLNYDPDQALNPESWDGNFYAVSPHDSIEHLASDALNIKESLFRMCKYILGKSIKDNNTNEVKDFKGMSKTIWEFISTIYESHWDNFFVDNNKLTFRSKVRSKFNPQVAKPQVSNKGKKTVKPTFVFPFLPPILAKSQKEVNKISKYFKKNNKPPMKKSYTQASSSK